MSDDTVGRIRDLLLSQSKAGRLRSLLDSIYGATEPVRRIPGMLGQFIGDAAPGGALNPELTPENMRTAAEYASMTPNPIGDVASLGLAADDLRKGDYGSAALNSVGMLPFVPAMGGVVKSGDFLRRHPDFASSAISKNGELIPGYHATNKDFDSFDPSKSRNNAVYFSTKPEVVEGMQYGGGEGGRTIASYVNLKNPAPYQMYEELRKKYGTRGVVDELKKLGYDGVGVEPRSGFFMAFDNNQIKSAISD